MGRKRKPDPACIAIHRPIKKKPGLSTGQRLSQERNIAARIATGMVTGSSSLVRDIVHTLQPMVTDEQEEESGSGRHFEGEPPASPISLSGSSPEISLDEFYEEEFPEEYGLRPLPRRGQPPGQPIPQPLVQPGPNDKRIFYSMNTLHSGSSKAEILRNERAHRVLNNGRHQEIRLEDHLEPFYADILRDYDLRHMFFCPGCARSVGSRKGRCANPTCNFFNLKCKRSGPRRRVELVLSNVTPQLQDVLKDHFDEIRENHDFIHTSKRNGTLNDRSDVRFFPRYSDTIETEAEFQNKTIQINLCLSSDGYRPKRLSKHEFWPLYLRVDGINAQDRDAYRNSTVSAVLFTRKSSTLELSNNFLSRLVEELEDLRVAPMTVTDNAGNQWRLRFHVASGVMDFAGLRDFYKLPRWNSELGCAKCEIPGQRIGGSRSWASRNVRYPRRTRATILRDAAQGVNGVTQETPAMELITPDQFPADSLHVLSEGICMDRFKDLFDRGRITELNLSPADITELKDSVSKVVNHTYCGAYVLSIEDRGSITGSEKQQLSNLVFPLAAACCPSLRTQGSCIAAGMLIGFWWLCRILEWHSSLTLHRIRVIKLVGNYVQFLQEQISPGSISMKAHCFYIHSIQEELDEVGSCFSWTAGFSESWHREFQLKHNQSATNCQLDSVRRYLLRKAVYRRFREATLANGHPDYHALLDETENAHVNRFPVKFAVNHFMYVPKLSEVKMRRVRILSHRQFVQNAFQGGELSSRMVVNGHVYAAHEYWTRTKDSQQDLCYVQYRLNNVLMQTFGSALLFVSDRNGQSNVLIEVFHTDCPFTNLMQCIATHQQPGWRIALRMLGIVSANNMFFRKVVRREILTIPTSSIKGRAVSVTLNGETFVSRI